MARKGTLTVKVIGDTKPFQRDLDGLGGKVRGAVGKIVKIGAAAAAAGSVAAAAFGVKALGAASDLNETLSKTQQVFKDATPTVTGFADEMADAFGLPKQDILDAASNIGLVAKASGLSEEAAAGMSTEMAQLAADAASFFNVPLPDALEKIRSGLVGEAEPLRSFGVLLSAAAVEAKAVEMGIAGAGEELTEQQKVMARSAIITEQMSDASGDLERTQDSLANRVKKLKGQFTNMTAELGMKLLPVGEKVVNWVSELTSGEYGLIKAFETGQKTHGETFEDMNALEKVLAEVGGAVQSLIDWVTENRKTLENLGRTALDVAKGAFKFLGDTIDFVRRNSQVLIPVAGALLGGLLAFKAIVGVLRAVAAAQAVLNAVMAANPIGLVVIAIAALVAGLVVAWQTSETFRDTVGRAFEAVKDGAQRLAANVIGGITLLVDAFLGFAETMIGAAAKAFGWVPGLGDKLEGAHQAIKDFREKANAELSRMQTNLRYSADVSPAMREIARLRDALRAIPGAATVTVGGTRGGLVMHSGGVVPGRPGQEVPAILEAGETVIPAGTRMAGGGGSVTVHVNGFVGNERQLADEIGRVLVRARRAGGPALTGAI